MIISASQTIYGLNVDQYYSAEANNSLTLRSTVASCLTGVVASNVYILKVTGSDGTRRLKSTPSAAPSSSIFAVYQVVVASQLDQSKLHSQLVVASSNGYFNQQLVAFAKQFGAAFFTNATSATIIIATNNLTVSPIFRPSSKSSSKWNDGAIAGLTIMCFVVVCAIGFGMYYQFMGGSSSQVNCCSVEEVNQSHVIRTNEGEPEYKTKDWVEFVNPYFYRVVVIEDEVEMILDREVSNDHRKSELEE